MALGVYRHSQRSHLAQMRARDGARGERETQGRKPGARSAPSRQIRNTCNFFRRARYPN